MKRILWICNTPLPEMQKEVGIRNCNEGWLVGISNGLRKLPEVDFYYAFPQSKFEKGIKRKINGICFYGFYNEHKNNYTIEKRNIEKFRSLVNKINPDIIHIFGTEFPHSLEWVKAIKNKSKIIVSLQGMISELAKVYTKGISLFDQLKGGKGSMGYECMLKEKYDFFRRGENEKEVIKLVTHIIGRTDWDRVCVQKISRHVVYHYCSETLRDIFYERTWHINDIRRNSIFLAQGYYPIKGLHILLKAMPIILKKYSDTKLYIAGDRSFLSRGTPYGELIKKTIRKYQLEQNVTFVGYLTDVKICEYMQQSHIMVMPSLLENSPNSIGEAMIMGVPVVAGAVGGIPSILENKKEGLLYHGADHDFLAKQICKILGDDEFAIRISEMGKKKARKLYNKDDNLEQLMDIYKQV